MFNDTTELWVFPEDEALRAAFIEAVAAAGETDLAWRREGRTTSKVATLPQVLSELLSRPELVNGQRLVQAFSLFGSVHEAGVFRSGECAASAALMINSKQQHLVANRWLKFVFYRLWTQRLVQFPLTFKAESSFSKDEMREMLPELVTCHLDNSERQQAALGVRLSLASSWREFAEIDLDTFAYFMRDMVASSEKCRELKVTFGKQTPSLFYGAFTRWCEAGTGNGGQYTEQQASKLRYWLKHERAGTTDLPPSQFINREAMIRENIRAKVRADHELRQRQALATLIEKHPDDPTDFGMELRMGNITPFEAKIAKAHQSVHSAAGDDILQYFRILRQSGRSPSSDLYPWRMGAFDADRWRVWAGIFERFDNHRAKQGYESSTFHKSCQTIFRDYLTCYVPWWKELAKWELDVPEDPSLFTRFGWWVEAAPSEDDLWPLPITLFYDKVRLGDGIDAYNGFVSLAEKFFEFCRGHAEQLRLLKTDFENPVVPSMDRISNRGVANKTNKTPIRREILPWLLRYGYAVEDFYNEMFRRVVEASPGAPKGYAGKSQQGIFYDASEWGFVPSFEFEERSYEIRDVPVLATWHTKPLRIGTEVRKVLVPVVSPLRMCLMALETGLRFQGIQWLCRGTYRSGAAPDDGRSLLVPLHVNTDKTRDEPFRTMIARRAMQILDREVAYQALCDEPEASQFVNYEKRSSTRFAPIQALFRSPETALPVSDSAYFKAWERLMVAFQLWFNANLADEEGEAISIYQIKPVVPRGSDKPVVTARAVGGQVLHSCPVRIALEHTPHSARASFITARSGLLPVEVIADLVGHTNTASTIHYTVESQAEIEARIVAVSDMLWEPDRDNPVHIRADEATSSLRASFERDRHATEKAFGFRTLGLLTEERPGGDGIALLRASPMGQIVFRETHICPVGEACPSDILAGIVEPRRCGLCPLAVKTVDHIPAIGAKMRQLLEQAREAGELLARMKARGEPMSARTEVADARKLDIVEYEGWKAAEQALGEALKELQAGDPAVMQVGMPEAVARHLRLVSRDVDAAEFILTRMVDSRVYSRFETATVRTQAAQLRQRLLSSTDAIAKVMDPLPNDPVASALAGVRVALEARGIAASYASALASISKGKSLSGPSAPALGEAAEA